MLNKKQHWITLYVFNPEEAFQWGLDNEVKVNCAIDWCREACLKYKLNMGK